MNLPGIEGQLMAAREYWSDKREAELTRLRERVAELESEKQTLRTMHLKMCEIAEERYHKLAAAERDAARYLCMRDMDDSDLLRMFASGKAHWDATLDAAMAPRSGGEGEHNG